MEPHREAWRALERELDAWAQAGRSATLWWRDDDCVEPTPALDRLLALAARGGTPIALAVVPGRALASLPGRLAATEAPVTVLQHGYSHRDRAPAGRKKQELSAGPDAASTLERLARGAARMAGLFGPCGSATAPAHLPVLVPPWNRIDAELLPALPGLGFRGISTDGPRAAASAAPDLVQVNTHVDLLHSLRRDGALNPGDVLTDLTDHLAARRQGTADPDEPSGLLTHHLAHDAASWALLDSLVARLSAHEAVAFRPAARVFAAPARPAEAAA